MFYFDSTLFQSMQFVDCMIIRTKKRTHLGTQTNSSAAKLKLDNVSCRDRQAG